MKLEKINIAYQTVNISSMLSIPIVHNIISKVYSFTALTLQLYSINIRWKEPSQEELDIIPEELSKVVHREKHDA